MAKKKYYVVWAGRETGVFGDWPTTLAMVDRFPGARYKSYDSEAEARQAFRAGKDVTAVPKRAPATGSRRSATSAPRAGELDLEHPATDPGPSFDVRIYCDGAADPNPGHAGSGIVVYRDGVLCELWYGLYHPAGTNNTAELNALHHALVFAERAIEAGKSTQVLSDSKYALSAISLWAAGWERRGWRRQGGEIKNLEIIQGTYALYERIKTQVKLTHIAGHAGIEGNELADRMAMHAVLKRQVELRPFEGEMDVAKILRMRAG
jgi:ribonuclease HI